MAFTSRLLNPVLKKSRRVTQLFSNNFVRALVTASPQMIRKRGIKNKYWSGAAHYAYIVANLNSILQAAWLSLQLKEKSNRVC